MYPPFVALLIVAAIFLGFALIPKRPNASVGKGREKPRFDDATGATGRPSNVVAMGSTASSKGKDNPHYSNGGFGA